MDTDNSRTAHGIRRRLKDRVRRFASAAAIAALALTGSIVATTPASAATAAAGYGQQDDIVGWMGGYTAPDGSTVYCIDPGVTSPYDPTTYSAGITGNVTSYDRNGAGIPLSADTLAKVNFLVSAYGQTSDNRTASAVHFAVQSIANPNALYNSGNYNGAHNLHEFVNYKLYSQVGGGETAAIADLATQYVNEASSITAGNGDPNVSGSLVFTTDGNNNYLGTVTAEFSGTVGVGTITLENGVFESTGTNTLAGARAGVAYPISGVSPLDEDGLPLPYNISGSAHWEVGSSGWLGAVELWLTPGQQQVVGPGGSATTTIDISGADPAVRSVAFEPVVTTVAPRIVEEGDTFTDTLTAEIVAGQWAQSSSGAYAPITANGTLYGPFNSRPDEAENAPSAAPVAGTAEAILDGVGEYTVETDFVSSEAGYYTWVWSIEQSAQRESVQRLLPDSYNWRDRFAQVVETSVTPNGFSARSQVVESEVAIGDAVADTLTIDLPDNGAWIRGEDGDRIPVVFRGTAYFVPGDTAPEFSETVPDGVEAIGTTTMTVREPGTFTSEELRAPFANGWVTWVWDIRTEDQPEEYRGYVKEWSDGFGIPEETTTVVAPEVTTKAQPASQLGGEIFDIATVTGRIPQTPTSLTFEAYKVPMVKTDGEWIVDAPEGTAEGDLSWVCTAEPVFSTSEPIPVLGEGDYQSEAFTPTEHGKYLWVETLSVTPEDDDAIVVHRGECGVRLETSFVVDVTTQAQETAKAGDTAIDTAIIDGFIPDGSAVTFDAYKVASDVPQAPVDVCTADVLIETTEPVEVPGGMHEGTEIDSPAVTLPEGTDDYKVYWIETVTDELGNVIAQGECGLPNETTTVEKSEGILAFTGADNTVAVLALGGAIAALLAGFSILAIRRRHETVTS